VPTLCNATMSTPLDQRTELLYAAADIDRRIDAVFEGFFVGADATEQASRCDDHELAPWFLRWLPEHQPILEAGFGTGRWLAWFEGQAWRSVGIERIAVLVEQARSQLPKANLSLGDFRELPFADCSFGSVVALGSIEHAPEGPLRALREFHRVLRPGGLCLLTVPAGTPMLRAREWLRRVRVRLLATLGREHLVKSAWRPPGSPVAAWCPVLHEDGCGWHFYEYLFTDAQMRGFLESAGLQLISAGVMALDKGVIFDFGRLAGSFDDDGTASLNFVGCAIKKLLPPWVVAQTLSYVVRRE